MRVFVLEDEIYGYRRPLLYALVGASSTTVATSREEAEASWQGFTAYDLVLLDHDMRGVFDSSEYPNTGHQFLSWALYREYPDGPEALWVDGRGLPATPKVILHSQNDVGRRNMRNLLLAYGIVPEEFPFHTIRYPAHIAGLLHKKAPAPLET
jgi:CheY-like chemotaxis protein